MYVCRYVGLYVCVYVCMYVVLRGGHSKGRLPCGGRFLSLCRTKVKFFSSSC